MNSQIPRLRVLVASLAPFLSCKHPTQNKQSSLSALVFGMNAPRGWLEADANSCVLHVGPASGAQRGGVAYLLVVGSLLDQVEDLVGQSGISQGESLGLNHRREGQARARGGSAWRGRGSSQVLSDVVAAYVNGSHCCYCLVS